MSFAVLVIFVAALVRGATGFGFALIAVPLLAFVWPPLLVTSVVIVLDLIGGLVLMRVGNPGALNWRDAFLLCGAGAFGTILGVLIVKDLPPGPALLGLNLVVLVSAAAGLLKVRWNALGHPVACLLVGLLTGTMIGAYGVGGTLVVGWLIAVDRSPAQSRAVLTLVFLMSDMIAILVRLALDAIPPGTFETVALLVPVLVLGVAGGSFAFRFIEPAWWRKGVSAILIAVACGGLLRSLFSG